MHGTLNVKKSRYCVNRRDGQAEIATVSLNVTTFTRNTNFNTLIKIV